MNRIQKYMILLVIILLGFSCVEQFTPDLEGFNANDLIVVEGQITDEEGPFRVKLTRTFEIDNLQFYAPPVYGAEVYIFDDKGNRFDLFYTVEGWYETEDKNLKGVVGNTYSISITTEDGKEYESSPVLMLDVPEIDNLYFEEFQIDRIVDLEVVNETWLDIYVDAKDTKGNTVYWKWEYEEVWEVETPKDSIVISVQPDFEPGYDIVANVEFKDGNQSMGWDNNKEKCWVTAHSANILIESTEKSTVNEIVRFPVKSIAPKEDRLHMKYSILVKQTALSKEIYTYWKKLKEANEDAGSMYDKVPSQILGNIKCCNGKEQVLGYFTASAVQAKRIFIKPDEHGLETRNAFDGCTFGFYIPRVINYYLGHIITVGDKKYTNAIGAKVYSTEPWCADCRMYDWNEKPDFWE